MNVPLTHPHLQFRFWCNAAQAHVSDYMYTGKVDELFQDDGVLIAEQCTGLKDLGGEFVFEGDIVQVAIGDDMPAWEGGAMVGGQLLKDLAGKTLALEVERDPASPSNLYLSGRSEDGCELFLPVSWSAKGRVVGRRSPGTKRQVLRGAE